MEPAVRGSPLIRNRPSPAEICTSAAIACLFLARGHFGFGVNELYHLVDAMLTNEASNHGSPFADIPECEVIYLV
jgi:hypothetical protein